MKIRIIQIHRHNSFGRWKYKWEVYADVLIYGIDLPDKCNLAYTLWGAKREARRYIKKLNKKQFEEKIVWEGEV